MTFELEDVPVQGDQKVRSRIRTEQVLEIDLLLQVYREHHIRLPDGSQDRRDCFHLELGVGAITVEGGEIYQWSPPS